MANTYTAVIPYESLDPLTIGASGDETRSPARRSSSRSRRRTCSPPIYPDEPEPVADATEAARRGARVAALRAALLGARRLGDEGRA